MNSRKTLIVVAIILLLTLAFIFTNSLLPVALSKENSLGVMGIVKPILELLVGEGAVTDHLVRKIAHFLEFFVLGVGVMMLCVLRCRTKLQNIINCLFVALATAVMDESLQMLTDRGPMVSDILLDFCGAFSGILIAYVFCIIFSKRKKSGSCNIDKN